MTVLDEGSNPSGFAKKKRQDTTPAAINELITHITLAPRDRDKLSHLI